jgi:hypothetical protein
MGYRILGVLDFRVLEIGKEEGVTLGKCTL